MTIKLPLISAFIVSSLLLGANLPAQSTWLPPTNRSSVSIETYRLDRPATSLIANGTAVFLTLRLKKNSRVTYVFDIPAARSDAILIFNPFVSIRGDSKATYGNPYWGISYSGNKSSSVTFDLGFRLPLAPNGKNSARNIGIEADYDRWEAFGPDLFSLRALIGRHWTNPANLISKWIRVGGTFLGPTGDQNSELLADFQAGIWLTVNNVTFGSTFITRTVLTEGGRSFIERSEFLLGFAANATFGSVRPGLSARIPIGNNGIFSLSQRLNAIYGANITFFFGNK